MSLGFKEIKRIAGFALVLCGALWFAPVAFAAQDVVSRFSKEMPEIPYHSDESFAEKTSVYKKRPYDDDLFAYKMNIPKDWEAAAEKGSNNFMVSDKLFIELNKYYGPPRMGGRSRVEISAVNIDYDYTAEQWYLKYILESGYTLEGLKVHNDRKVESLMVVMEGDYSYHLRTIAHINGTKMIMVQYYLPALYWEEEAPMQATVMRSFELLNNKVEKIGEYRKFQFLDVAELFYPAAWKTYSKPMRSVERLNARFLNMKNSSEDKSTAVSSVSTESSDGHVDIDIISSGAAPSLIAEIENYKKELESTGIVVGKKLDYETGLTFDPDVTFSVSEVYEAIDSSSDFMTYELWFGVFVAGNYYYFVTLLTPSRDQNYVAWAKNMRGYQHIVASLSPTTGAYLER